uniref:Uncharacterized protein n=1 Tax=Cacopsylla melanoneura TaxID=428564 RepID=A0A8D8TEQ2_9HEMI
MCSLNCRLTEQPFLIWYHICPNSGRHVYAPALPLHSILLVPSSATSHLKFITLFAHLPSAHVDRLSSFILSAFHHTKILAIAPDSYTFHSRSAILNRGYAKNWFMANKI